MQGDGQQHIPAPVPHIAGLSQELQNNISWEWLQVSAQPAASCDLLSESIPAVFHPRHASASTSNGQHSFHFTASCHKTASFSGVTLPGSQGDKCFMSER